MLNELIVKTEELIAENASHENDHATVSVTDLRSLAKAARLLADIHPNDATGSKTPEKPGFRCANGVDFGLKCPYSGHFRDTVWRFRRCGFGVLPG